MKILKVYKYFDRELFLIEIEKGFIHLFYRSAGKNNLNTKGTILPCFLLATPETRKFVDPNFNFVNGWISKIILSNNFTYRYFSKDLKKFPEKINEINKFINLSNYEIEKEEDPRIINLTFINILLDNKYKFYSFNLGKNSILDFEKGIEIKL